MTHPGVGPTTALAFVLVIGSLDRSACGNKIGSYLGLIPCEDSRPTAGGTSPIKATRWCATC